MEHYVFRLDHPHYSSNSGRNDTASANGSNAAVATSATSISRAGPAAAQQSAYQVRQSTTAASGAAALAPTTSVSCCNQIHNMQHLQQEPLQHNLSNCDGFSWCGFSKANSRPPAVPANLKHYTRQRGPSQLDARHRILQIVMVSRGVALSAIDSRPP